MMSLKKFFRLFQRNERGVTALEYAILGAVVVTAVAALGTKISSMYTKATTAMETQVDNATTTKSGN